MLTIPDVNDLTAALKTEATELGFGLVAVTPAVSLEGFARLQDWLAKAYHGEMSYLERYGIARSHPLHVLPTVRNLLMVGLHYRTADAPDVQPGEARISRYAWGTADYHDVIKQRLKTLADWLHARRPGCTTRAVVDTAPLLEREFAQLAGLGWFGKNTMLINKHAGSFFFLGALLTDVDLTPDQPHMTSHCGTCTRCLDACPTEAFPEPGVLDATRCISYLTIELKSPIPEELRPGIGDWLFGCDVCQEVCPWNRKAPVSTEAAFAPTPDLHPASAADLLSMDDSQFRLRFRKTPLLRPKRAGILRNACIVLGNTRDPQFIGVLSTALNDAELLIRGAAAWALGEITGPLAETALQSRLSVEDNADIQREITSALARISHSTTDEQAS